VVQGSAPAFDMTIARDRVIGILFGNLVIALIFTFLWPVSVARRIDPAIAALLRQLGAMVSARSRPMRWALAAKVQTALGAIEEDIDLTRYEPSAIRPSPDWLKRRRDASDAVASLQGLLLIDTEQAPAVSRFVAHRLLRLAEVLAPGPEEIFSHAQDPACQSVPAAESVLPSMDASIEVPLRKLEQAIAEPSVINGEGRIDDAYA
jgi:multidrug resistance protein MdtO